MHLYMRHGNDHKISDYKHDNSLKSDNECRKEILKMFRKYDFLGPKILSSSLHLALHKYDELLDLETATKLRMVGLESIQKIFTKKISAKKKK